MRAKLGFRGLNRLSLWAMHSAYLREECRLLYALADRYQGPLLCKGDNSPILGNHPHPALESFCSLCSGMF